jgi:hypothetical protein
MKALLLTLGLCALLTSCGLGGNVEELAKVDHFAFGGIGVAGTTSKGELAFRKVMADQSAREELLKTLAAGSAAAQCYALAGLHTLADPSFEEQAKRFTKDSREVTTIGGCMMGKQPMSSVVANIRAGRFDQSVQAPPPRAPR